MADPAAARIAVAGAGEMGLSAIRLLASRLPDASLTVIDRSADRLARAQEVAPGRIAAVEAEIGAESLPGVPEADVVVNFAGPFYVGSDALARAALAAGTAYIDICDDMEGAEAVLALDDEARRAGVPLITGAGNSPGISNVIGRRLLARNPQCDGIRVVWVVRDADPGGLAPLRHMLHMAVEPCPIWDGGQMVETAGFAPKTAREHVLPEPVGKITAFDTAHPEPLTMSRAFPQLRHVSVQGALLPLWANDAFSTLGRIGFGYHDLTVEAGGVEVRPDEVLWKVLWARHEKRAAGRDPDQGMTCVQVQALKGDDVVATTSIVDDHSMSRTTGLGAAAAVLAVLDERPPAGAWGTEVLDPDTTLAYLLEMARAEGALPGGLIEEERVPLAKQD